MRIVFMGSSAASATTLRAILKNPLLKIVGVVTQPDRPSGRRRRLTPCPCKAYAMERKLGPIITPEKVNAPEIIDRIRALKPDIIVVVAFGQFLGKTLLGIPPLGCVNGHFSLLPKFRGAAPVQYAIISGETVSGVTVMQMAPGMDDGDILLQAREPICSDDTGASLMDRLAILGAVTMAKALRLMLNGPLPHTPQDHTLASYASKMQKNDGMIDWRKPGAVIERRIRGLDPWPGAFTYLPRKYAKPGGIATGRVKILAATVLHAVAPEYDKFACGSICALSAQGPVVRTGGKPLILTALQLDGGKQIDGHSFLNGHPMALGDTFETVSWIEPLVSSARKDEEDEHRKDGLQGVSEKSSS